MPKVNALKEESLFRILCQFTLEKPVIVASITHFCSWKDRERKATTKTKLKLKARGKYCTRHSIKCCSLVKFKCFALPGYHIGCTPITEENEMTDSLFAFVVSVFVVVE